MDSRIALAVRVDRRAGRDTQDETLSAEPLGDLCYL